MIDKSVMDFDTRWDIVPTVDYVLNRSYKRVALQFPDELLGDAPLVARRLQDALKAASDCQVRFLQWCAHGTPPLRVLLVAVSSRVTSSHSPAVLTAAPC